MERSRFFPIVLLAALLGSAAGGCNTAAQEIHGASPVSTEVGDAVVLHPGQQADVEDAGLFLRFVDVPEDSRCPTGVQCPWAGNARVRVEVERLGLPAVELILNTALEPRAGTVDGYQIELLDLAPERRAEEVIAPQSYRPTFRVMPAPVEAP